MIELFKFYFFLFLLCHFIGDYYFQSEKMALKKGHNFKKTLIHSVLYSIPFFTLFMLSLFYELSPFFDLSQFGLFILIIVVSHFILDVCKGQIEFLLKQKVLNNRSHGNNDIKNIEMMKIEKIIYIADQICHFSILLFFSVLLSTNSNFFIDIAQDTYFRLKIALFVIIVISPTNTTFKKLFSKYQPQKTINTNENKPILGAGSIVGSLERLLMGVLISID